MCLQFNVQSGAGNAGSEAYGSGGAGVSSGSASSGAQSPGSPPHAHLAHHASRLRAKEEDLSAHGRASADGMRALCLTATQLSSSDLRTF